AALLLSPYFGGSVTGWYALAVRALQTPLGLIGNAVGQVFFSSAAAAKERGALRQETLRAFTSLVQIGLPLLSIIGLAAPELFAFVFGREWRVAGSYAQLL